MEVQDIQKGLAEALSLEILDCYEHTVISNEVQRILTQKKYLNSLMQAGLILFLSLAVGALMLWFHLPDDSS